MVTSFIFKRSKWNIRFSPGFGWSERSRFSNGFFEFAGWCRGTNRRSASRCSSLEATASFSCPTVCPRFEELHIIQDDSQLGLFLAILAGPLIESQMTFDINLLAFMEVLLHLVCQLSSLFPVECFNV